MKVSSQILVLLAAVFISSGNTSQTHDGKEMEIIDTSSKKNVHRLRIEIDYTKAKCVNSDQLVLSTYYKQSADRNKSASAILEFKTGVWIGRDEDDYSGNTEVIENMTSVTFRLISDMSEDNPSYSVYKCPNCTLANLKLLAKMNSWEDLVEITKSVPKFQFYDLIACANFLNWRHFDEFLDNFDFLSKDNFDEYFVFLPESMKKNIVGLKVVSMETVERFGEKLCPYLNNYSININEFDTFSNDALVSALNAGAQLNFDKLKWERITSFLKHANELVSEDTLILEKFFDQSVYEYAEFGVKKIMSTEKIFPGSTAFFSYFLNETVVRPDNQKFSKPFKIRKN